MMKRVGFIFEKIIDKDNILWAIDNSARGKRKRKNVQRVLENAEKCAEEIQEMLSKKTYQPAEYFEEVIWDVSNKKERVIYKPKYYPDQVIHWCLIQQIEFILRRGMYYYSCASIPGKGIHFALKAVKKWLKNDRKHTKYCVQMDIRKFYPSIDQEILKGLFRKKIKDQDTLWLIDRIVDSHAPGLPIGNYTSQWFSNFYLGGFDHYVKSLGVKYYVRYMDDLCLFGNNKKKLHGIRRRIEEYLNEVLHLKVKDNWQLYRVDVRGVDFVGYRIFRDYCLLRNRTALRIARRMRRIAVKENMSYQDATSIMSYLGWLKHSNTYNFTQKHILSRWKMEGIKEVIRRGC